MAITQAQIDALQSDFNNLLDDILRTIPHSSQIDMAVMFFKMAEGIVITYATQHKVT